MSVSSSVIGHYVKHGSGLLPALAQSTPLFKGICCDNLEAVQDALAPGAPVDEWMSVLVWDAQEAAQHQPQPDTHPDQAAGEQQTAQVQVKPRTLAMIAAFHGSERVLGFLLGQGANPRLRTPDAEALCCYDFIKPDSSASSVRALLDSAHGSEVAPSQCTPAATTSTACQLVGGSDQELSRTGSGESRSSSLLEGQQQDLATASPAHSQPRSSAPATPPPSSAAATPPGTAHAAFSPGPGSMADLEGGGRDTAEPGLGYSTKELTRQEYATDEFRMFCFKVLPCSKRYAHDWRACPFAHPTENARRRDPREVMYSSIACPDYKQGFCIRGDTCQYAHGVFESWLHPSRYRTQLCKDGERCHRPVCFFAHTLVQLRAPTHTFTPGPAERLRVPRELLSAAGAGGAALSPGAPPQMSPGNPVTLGGLPPLSPDAGLLRDQDLQAATAAAGGYGQDSPNSYQMPPVHMSPLGGAAAAAAAAAAIAPSITVEGPGLLPSAAPQQQQQLMGGLSPGGASSSSSGGRRGGSRSGGGPPGLMPGGMPGPGMVPMPRMSNAFARKHGIDPKHNPLLNVQAIALQQEVHQASRRGRNRQGQRRPHNQQQQQQQQQQRHSPPGVQHSPGHASSGELQMALQQLHSPGQQAQSPGPQQQAMQALMSPPQMQQQQQLQLQDQYLLHLQQQQQLAAMHQQQLAAMSPPGQLLPQVHMYSTPGLMPMQDPGSLALLLGGMSMGPAMGLPGEVMGAAGVANMMPLQPQLAQLQPLQGLVPVTQDPPAMQPAPPGPF